MRFAFPAMLMLLAAPLALAGGLSSTTIDNDIPEGTIGHWQVTVDPGVYSEDGEITAHRAASNDTTTDSLLYQYNQFIDVGNDGGAFFLDDTATSASGDAEADTASSSGSFQGQNGTVNWTAVSSIADNSPTMISTITFDAAEGTTLGTMRFINYLDEDVNDGADDDVFFTRGTAAGNNLQLFTLDNTEEYGVSHSGATTTGGGLQNFTFAGWAAGPYDAVEENLQGDGQAVSPSGVVFDLDSFNHPTFGPSYGPDDITSILAWDVNPEATHAVVVIALGGVVEAPPADCVPGDVFPEGGNGRVTLADAFQAWKTARFNALHHHDDGGMEGIGEGGCGDVWPGHVTCGHGSTAFFTQVSWCPEGDGTISMGDAMVIARLALGMFNIDCSFCNERDQRAMTPVVPGDVAPAGAPDGVVDVADAVRALRASVGLDTLSADDVARGDVMPAHAAGSVLEADGDRRVDVADVVGLLRSAVGLQTIAWPERHVTVPLTGADLASVDTGMVVSGWPSWAEPVSAVSDACPDASGLDPIHAAWGFQCVNEAGLSSTDPSVVFTYRGPAVDPATLHVDAQVLGPDMNVTTLNTHAF